MTDDEVGGVAHAGTWTQGISGNSLKNEVSM
jgi:hypothetical protein